jgi:dynein heavy chain
MRSIEFEFEFTQDGQTIIVVKLPELIAIFDEFFLRVSVLKTNPNIKNFLEKLTDIEKMIKSVHELITEWAEFQRNYVYLNVIF